MVDTKNPTPSAAPLAPTVAESAVFIAPQQQQTLDASGASDITSEQLEATRVLPMLLGRFDLMDGCCPNLTYGGTGRVYKVLARNGGKIYAMTVTKRELDGSEDFQSLANEFHIHSAFDVNGGHKNIAQFIFGNENSYSMPTESTASWSATRSKSFKLNLIAH